MTVRRRRKKMIAGDWALKWSGYWLTDFDQDQLGINASWSESPQRAIMGSRDAMTRIAGLIPRPVALVDVG
tara:strand:- start:844 stop:1056 length:213 start_codon:yes stop_codon:yes gene_type:complete